MSSLRQPQHLRPGAECREVRPACAGDQSRVPAGRQFELARSEHDPFVPPRLTVEHQSSHQHGSQQVRVFRRERRGKRFELVVDGAIDDAKLKELNQIAATLLSNPVIEDFTLRVVETAEVGG